MLRRNVARVDEEVHIGGLLAVVADPSIAESQIENVVADFQSHYVSEKAEEEASGPTPETLNAQGHRLCYFRRGDGPEAAILVHGFGGDPKRCREFDISFGMANGKRRCSVSRLFPALPSDWKVTGLLRMRNGFADSGST